MGERGPRAEDGDGPDAPGAIFALRSAPLPTWQEFEEYERILPGLADRIVRMAEDAQRARIDADLVPIKAEGFALKAATIGVSFFPWLGILGALGLAAKGESTAAIISGLIGAVSAGPQIIAATRRPRAAQPQPPKPQAPVPPQQGP